MASSEQALVNLSMRCWSSRFEAAAMWCWKTSKAGTCQRGASVWILIDLIVK